MSVREVKGTPIYEHEADAVLFAYPEDFSEDDLKGLQGRYPGIVKRWKAVWDNPKFEPGAVAPITIHNDVTGKDEKVLLVCLAREPKIPGYNDLLQVLRKIAKSKEKTGIGHVAVGYPGTSKKRIHPNAVEDTLRVAADNGAVVFDFHSRE